MTPNVVLPAFIVETLDIFCTSRILHSCALFVFLTSCVVCVVEWIIIVKE